MHHHLGHLLLEAGHQCWCQCEARQAETNLEAPGDAAGQRHGMALKALAVFDQGARLGEQLGADDGQLGAVATPVEQGAAEGLLQSLDLLGERRLGDEQPAGGLPVVGGIGQGDECLQLLQIEFHSMWLSKVAIL